MAVTSTPIVPTDADDGGKEEKAKKEPKATFGELYQFTSTNERILLLVALFMATGAGVAQPMMLIAFSDLFTQLGTTSVLDGAMVGTESMMSMLMILIYIGIALFVCDSIAISSVNYVCASQMLKYKQAYLKAVLRQDVAWYDVSKPEELSTAFAEAMVKVQKGLKAQNMICIGMGMGFGSVVIAFYPTLGQPAVAGVTLLTVPLLMIAASVMMYFVESGEKLRSKAYGQAGGIATECLFSMRTITALGIEKKFEQRYTSALSRVRRVTIINIRRVTV